MKNVVKSYVRIHVNEFMYEFMKIYAIQKQRNSLSNSPCPLGRARGRGRYILLARAIKNKPFKKKKRYSCPVPRVPMATIRPRSNAKIQQLLWI